MANKKNDKDGKPELKTKEYDKELRRLQAELCRFRSG